MGINRRGLDNLILHVVLSSCYKECAILVDDIEEPVEVHIPFVYQIDSSHLDTDFIQSVNIVTKARILGDCLSNQAGYAV